MRMYNNYGRAEAMSNEGFQKLPAGGYVMGIVLAEEVTTSTNKLALRLKLDIAEGEYRGFFTKQYNQDTRQDKKYGCYYYIMEPENPNCAADDPVLRRMKGAIKAIEESNHGFNFEATGFNERTLTGKLIGGLFRREEFVNRKGNSAWSTKCTTLISAEKIRSGDFTVPADKNLEVNQTAANTYSNDAFVPVDPAEGDKDLPF